jgi:hypothetical protein
MSVLGLAVLLLLRLLSFLSGDGSVFGGLMADVAVAVTVVVGERHWCGWYGGGWACVWWWW